VPTQKRKDAAEGEGIEVTAAIAKPQKKKKTSKTGNTDEIVEEASLLPEGSEDPDAAKKKKKEKASKESVCKWLRATHIAKVSNAVEGRPHIVRTPLLALSLPGTNGAAAHTQDLIPGDRITAWTEKTANRKLEWVVYAIEKGVQADYWHVRCRLDLEGELTTIPVANITKIITGVSKETKDERDKFLDELDERQALAAKAKKEEDNQRAKQKKAIKKQAAVSPRKSPTVGNCLRPGDFQEALRALREHHEDLKKERQEDHAKLTEALQRVSHTQQELAKETTRLERIKNDLTSAWMKYH
jgi:hypothetical protein